MEVLLVGHAASQKQNSWKEKDIVESKWEASAVLIILKKKWGRERAEEIG